jgi:hypothetical protein
MMAMRIFSRRAATHPAHPVLADLSWQIKHVWPALGSSPKGGRFRECQPFTKLGKTDATIKASRSLSIASAPCHNGAGAAVPPSKAAKSTP